MAGIAPLLRRPFPPDTRPALAAPCGGRDTLEPKEGSNMAKRAFCIGINDYPYDGSDLKGCVNDANDWANLLVEHFDFHGRTCGW